MVSDTGVADMDMAAAATMADVPDTVVVAQDMAAVDLGMVVADLDMVAAGPDTAAVGMASLADGPAVGLAAVDVPVEDSAVAVMAAGSVAVAMVVASVEDTAVAAVTAVVDIGKLNIAGIERVGFGSPFLFWVREYFKLKSCTLPSGAKAL